MMAQGQTLQSAFEMKAREANDAISVCQVADRKVFLALLLAVAVSAAAIVPAVFFTTERDNGYPEKLKLFHLVTN